MTEIRKRRSGAELEGVNPIIKVQPLDTIKEMNQFFNSAMETIRSEEPGYRTKIELDLKKLVNVCLKANAGEEKK